MTKQQGRRIKNEDRYEKLKEKGMSKQKAARIANSNPTEVGKKGGKSPKYEEWSREDLYEKAKEVGIEGRSSMSKQELIRSLRNS